MTLVITMKQHDTRPVANITLLVPNPADITTAIISDLTSAASAKLLGKLAGGSTTISSTLTFGTRALGIVIWTPVAADTLIAGTFNAEIEVTWNDGGIETFPNDSYFTIYIVADEG